MQTIQLTQGRVARVDDSDYEGLRQYKWHALKNKQGVFYAARTTNLRGGRRGKVWMHAAILDTPKGLQTDHRDGDGLNNQRSNLRVVTPTQNMHNRTRKQSKCGSRFRGVSWHRRARKWVAEIRVDGKKRYLGLFTSEHAAAQAYDDAGLQRDPVHFTPNFQPVVIEVHR